MPTVLSTKKLNFIVLLQDGTVVNQDTVIRRKGDWQNVQFMTARERKHFIKQIDKLSSSNGGFIHYAAKEYLKKLVDASDCYFQKPGSKYN